MVEESHRGIIIPIEGIKILVIKISKINNRL